MIQALKNKISVLVLALALMLPVLAVVPAAAQPNIEDGLCTGSSLQVDTAKGNCATSTKDAVDDINGIIETVINIFSLIVGVISVIMIIIGGLKYITSGGDSGNVTGAKNTILYAIVGLVVVALAQIIVQFVLERATN